MSILRIGGVLHVGEASVFAAARRLAVFAIQNADALKPMQRADLLTDAAAFLPDEEADLCRSTASFIRHAEDHQLKLKNLFATK